MASLAKQALRTLRPRFGHEVEAVVAPVYARRDELTTAVDDIRRILSDQMDAASEEAAIFGRILASLRAEVQELHASVDALTAAVAGLAGKSPEAFGSAADATAATADAAVDAQPSPR